ncbi:MAG: autotransporter-associated beta strand repeat-containing protein, partial [Oceanospirillaceae bacterium]|nr:autotransporter-associated beta strand repeat-containing protein [Oceanospirillaceae bacterium]
SVVASGGGSGDNTAGGSGTAGQGFSGGRGDGVSTYGYLTGGGGGAGAAGGDYNQASGQGSGDGGVGLYIDWADQLGLGDAGYFGGGGGGGMHTTNANHDPGQGGLGGGGDGAEAVGSSGVTAALSNTGGGGGGNGLTNAYASRGGNGGSGIIAIRYLGADVSTGGSESSAINGYSTNVFSATGSSTLTLNSVDVLLRGSISGADNLTLHAEGGKIRLSGDNTFSGDTTVLGGTVEMTGSGVLGEAGVYAGNIDTSGALLFNSSVNQTLSGDISGSGSISKSSGAGSVLVLSGSNTYTGTTSVTFGTLRVANDSGLGSAAGDTTVGSDAVLELTGVDIGSEALTLAGGALVATGGASSASGTVALSASTAIRVDSSSLTLSGSISGTGYGLTKLGSGELILSAANTYTGTTTVSAGTLTLSNAFALGNSASGTLIEAGSTLDLNNLTLVGEALTLNGGTLSAASGSSVIASPITLTADSTIEVSGTELSISGGIAGGNFGVTKTGTGALVLSGANTYSGDTTVSAGTLQLGDNSSTGAINNSSIVNNALMVLDFSQDIQISSDITGSGTLAITPRYSLLKDWGASSSLSNTSYEVVATNSSVAEVLNRVTGGLLHGSATGQPINGGEAGVNNKFYDPATNTASFFVTYHDAVYAKRVKVLLRQNGATVEAKVDSTIAEYQQHNNTTAYSGADLIAENHTFDFTGQMGYATSYTAGGYGLRALDQSVQVTLLGDVQLDGAITLGEAEYTSDASLYKDLRFTKASIAVGSSGSLNLNSLGISETSDLSEPGFAIRNDGVIDFDLTSDWSFDAVITGSGSIKKNGSGLLSLTGTNFYTGQTLVSEGTVSIGSAQSISPAYSAIGVGSLRIASGATLDLFGHSLSNNLVTLGGSIVNSGTSNVSISGAITLEGDATISSLGGGELTLASTVDGPYSLTISTNSASTDAHLTLSGSLGQTTALSGLYADTGSAPTLINSAISTTGKIEFLSGALAVSANIETTGGDLTLTGDSGSATATGLDGVNIGNVEIKTLGSGDISILGRSGNGNIDGLIGVEVSGGGAVISSAGALTITGRSESLSSSVTRGVWIKGQLSSVGDMIINGTANSNNNYDVSLQDASLTTQAGSISLHANNAAGRINTAGTVTISAGASEDIKLYANVHRTSAAGASINTSGIVSIQAKTGSSSFAEVFDTGVYNYASTVTNLALGGASNGSPLSVTETISIAGPISFTGSDISVDAGVVTTNSNVIFNASGTVTQGVNGYLESSGLALKGTGDFALESAQNSIITLAAGNDDLSAIGSLSFTNNGALTIGSVNPTGITASGNVSISATDLSVTEAIDVGTNTLTLTLSGAG